MVNRASMHDIGSLIYGVNCLNPVVITAGAAGDGSQSNGFIIDRRTDLSDRFYSVKVMLPYSYALSTGDTATVISNFQHSDSTASSAFVDFANIDGSTVTSAALAGDNGTTGNGVLQYTVDLGPAKRYVRVQATVTISSTATDTVDIAGVAVFGGGDFPPAS